MRYCRKLGLLALLWLSMLPAYAAMVTTSELAAEPERAQLVSISEMRQHAQQQLIEMGVEHGEAIKRVNRMTDQQLISLQEEISEQPAGAGVSNTNLLLIIIILILLL